MPCDSMLSNYFNCRRDCTIKRSEIRAKMFHLPAKKNNKDAREGTRKDLKITCKINIVKLTPSLKWGKKVSLQDTFFLPSISNMDISTSPIFFPYPPFCLFCAHVNFAFFLNFPQSSLCHSVFNISTPSSL